jgi:hypothetical protein
MKKRWGVNLMRPLLICCFACVANPPSGLFSIGVGRPLFVFITTDSPRPSTIGRVFHLTARSFFSAVAWTGKRPGRSLLFQLRTATLTLSWARRASLCHTSDWSVRNNLIAFTGTSSEVRAASGSSMRMGPTLAK